MSESSADEEEIRSAKRSKMDKVVEISGTDERRPTRGSSRVAAVAAKKLLSQVAKNRSETPTTPPSRRPRGRPRKGTTAAATPKNSVKKPPGSRARKKRRREIDEGSSDDSDVEEFVFPTQSDLEGEEDQLDFNLYESDVDLDAEPEDFGDTISIQSGSKASRFCPWIDQEETLAPLHLPLSSEDLLIPLRLIPAVLEIYEVLRRFGRTMRLSPFRIEDFCAGLMAVEFSPLIMEIHLALLKSLMREDELNGTTLSRLEEKSFSYAATHLPLDLVTWPALLKSYLESHPKFDSLAKEICAHPLFPQVSTEEKVIVLKFLVNRFVATEHFAKVDLQSQGEHPSEDNCRNCGKVGDLIVCDYCPAVFHLRCLDPPMTSVPGEWSCPLCRASQVEGVNFGDTDVRNSPIGFDRHGRRYYMLARRIMIESLPDEKGAVSIWYYSCAKQLERLMDRLDSEDLEKQLCEAIQSQKNHILKEMNVTISLTMKLKPSSMPKSYLLEIDDVNTDGMKIGAQELSGGPQNETDSLFDFDSQENDSVVAEMIDDGDLELLRRFETEQIDEDDLTDGELERLIAVRDKRDRNFKVFELQQQKKLKKEAQAIRQTQSLSCKNDLTPFKLGMENSHRRYVNHYRTENAARPYAERKQETIKMRMIWSKFCPKEVENFNWKLSDYMSDPNNGFRNMLRTALIDFSRRLPSAFFHPKWKSADSDWKFSLLKAVEPPQFAKCLAIIEAFSRSVVFMPYFFTGISDTELVRETVVERERRKLLEKMRKDRKQREDAALSGNPENLESSTNDSDIVWVKYPNGLPKHQIWKGNSDEFYRVNGRGCLGGWIWFSCNWAPLGRRGAKLAGFRGHIECEESSYKSFINDLLKEVMLNEMERNTITEYPDGSSLLIGSASSQMACATLPLTFAVGGSSWVPERLMTIEKLQLRRHYPTVDVSLGLRDKSIYYTAAKESFLDGLLKIRSCILTAEATRNPIRLKNVSGGHKFRPNSFPAAQSFLCRRSSKRSILVLPKTICRQLARHGGNLTEIPGYIEVTKSNTFAWPYPCSRPNFQTCWRYTLNSNQISLASVAFHLRQLHSLIRWNDVDKSGQNPAKVITHDEGLLTQTEILHHKEISMSNQQMYLVKTIRLRYEMLEEDGRKARNRRILKGVLKPHMKEVTADTQWLSEHDVSLAQIRHYHEKIANQLSFSFDSSTVVTSADIDQLIKNALTVEVEDEFRDRLHHLALEHRTSAFTPKSQREDNDNRMTMTTRRAFAEEKMAPLDAILTYGKYDYKVAKLMDTEERNEYWRLHECDKVLRRLVDQVVKTEDQRVSSVRRESLWMQSPMSGQFFKKKPPSNGYGFRTIRGKVSGPLTANPTVLGTKFHPISSTRDSLHIKDQRSDTEKLLDRLASGLKQEIVKRRIRMIQTAQQELMDELNCP